MCLVQIVCFAEKVFKKRIYVKSALSVLCLRNQFLLRESISSYLTILGLFFFTDNFVDDNYDDGDDDDDGKGKVNEQCEYEVI